jgi:2-amino-4-hydroxy-6-hydroxymethyldihydropteridine diphosphokinase
LHNVYISLGSNLGEQEANLRNALDRLSALGMVVAVSAFYETEPVEFTEQPWFLNCAVQLRTELSARQLLDGILQIEREMGRIRDQDKGPRIIDLDILLFDDLVVNEEGLTIPHPAMHKRRFVLEPLAEIAHEVIHPVFRKDIGQLLAALQEGQTVKKFTER